MVMWLYEANVVGGKSAHKDEYLKFFIFVIFYLTLLVLNSLVFATRLVHGIGLE